MTGRERGNLPSEPSTFVGRDGELEELAGLLARHRLVTVTGVGGVGKTRLALRAAARRRDGTGDEAWFTDLSAVRDVARAVADALGMREVAARPPLRLLTSLLVRRRMLLILDSCEPVLPECSALAEALLSACPGLRILATSRDLLDVPGEIRYEVGPLPVPASVTLFVARTRVVRPGFRLQEANREAVAGICRRLDGIPLAIELAAALLRTLSPGEALHQLTDRFGTPVAGNGAAERHRTLRACVDWSFDLCTEPERRLWTRLSVFADDFDLDVVEGVCADDLLLRDDLLDLVSSLVGKSVLVARQRGDRVRYRMLDTLRDYGRARLGDEEAALRRRHLGWYESLVARAQEDIVSPRQPYWIDRLWCEYPNLRAAVEYALAAPERAEAALRITVTMPWVFWVTRGLFGQARSWLDAGLAAVTPSTGLHAQALLLAGCLAGWQHDSEVAAGQLDRGEDLARALNDPARLAFAAFARGLAVGMRNDLPAAIRILEGALERLSEVPRPDLDLRLRILIGLGVDAALAGDRPRAEARYREIMAITDRHGGSYYRCVALWALGIEAFRRGDLDEAAGQVAESLRIRREHLPTDRYGITLCVEAVAWIAAGAGEHRRAATLLGAADAVWEEMGTDIAAHGNLILSHRACARQARDHLGGEAYEAAFRDGRELPYREAIRHALSDDHTW